MSHGGSCRLARRHPGAGKGSGYNHPRGAALKTVQHEAEWNNAGQLGTVVARNSGITRVHPSCSTHHHVALCSTPVRASRHKGHGMQRNKYCGMHRVSMPSPRLIHLAVALRVPRSLSIDRVAGPLTKVPDKHDPSQELRSVMSIQDGQLWFSDKQMLTCKVRGQQRQHWQRGPRDELNIVVGRRRGQQ